MTLFGYPVAQRAALAIQRSLAELNRKNDGTGKPALVARIAIDLGPAVVEEGIEKQTRARERVEKIARSRRTCPAR
jgi:class 3 adenylate cyclase